jgi:hypothetical protein
MQLCVLHLDDSFRGQSNFLTSCHSAGAVELELGDLARPIRLWGFHSEIDAFQRELANRLQGTSQPRLAFIGSGDFHHISAFLLGMALKEQQSPTTLIHFDNHPDWVKFEKGMHCGSWINRALEDRKVAKVITIGVCSHDLESPEPKLANLDLLSQGRLEIYPYQHEPSQVSGSYGRGASFVQIGNQLRWHTIQEAGEQNFLDSLIDRIQTETIYLTIDKDVLAPTDAVTNWDQGRMGLAYLISLIEHIARHKVIIGADVVGDYSRPAYSGGPRALLSKYYEAIKDHPRQMSDAGQRAAINDSGNRMLLKTLTKAMQ